MKAHRTIRYRLMPLTLAKHRKLMGHCGACRFVWNHFVAKCRDEYIVYGRSEYRAFTTQKQFTVLRNNRCDWLKEYSAHNVRAVLKQLETTYRNKFSNGSGLPKFKSKYDTVPSCPLANDGTFRIEGDSINIQRVGWCKLRGNNPTSDWKAVSGTIKYECGKWYAYVVYQGELTKALRAVETVGIDRNVKQITCSDGTVYRLPDEGRLRARKRRYQRTMARRQCGSRKKDIPPSKRYLRAKMLHRKTAQKIAQARTNWCHQVSREIANKYAHVVLEDLNTKGMTAKATGKGASAKRGLNRGIQSSNWYKLEQCLSYKTNVSKVPAAYTSRTCHACGHTDKDNRKTQSEFKCQKCGNEANADYNAALNIMAAGIAATARGGGDVSRPVRREYDNVSHVEQSI